MDLRMEYEERALDKDGGHYAIANALLEIAFKLGRIEEQIDALRQIWLRKDEAGDIADSIIRAGEKIGGSIDDLPGTEQIEELIKVFRGK